jgi:hypothetical protein
MERALVDGEGGRHERLRRGGHAHVEHQRPSPAATVVAAHATFVARGSRLAVRDRCIEDRGSHVALLRLAASRLAAHASRLAPRASREVHVQGRTGERRLSRESQRARARGD